MLSDIIAASEKRRKQKEDREDSEEDDEEEEDDDDDDGPSAALARYGVGGINRPVYKPQNFDHHGYTPLHIAVSKEQIVSMDINDRLF